MNVLLNVIQHAINANWKKIVQRIDSNGVTENPEFIQKGDTAVAVFESLNPFVAEEYDKYPPLSRFIIRENKNLIAVGLITSVEKK